MTMHRSERGWIMFISGIIWIPYCLLMLYLFFEQYWMKRFPQFLINLCLFLGCCFRTIWFFSYEHYHAAMAVIYINRIAILLQFSALSVLMMMWSRVLRVSNRAISTTNSQFRVNNPSIGTNIALKGSSQPGLAILPTSTSLAPAIPEATPVIPEVDDSRSLINKFLMITIVSNVVVWLFVLISIGLSIKLYPSLYNVNIIILAVVCLLEGVSILLIGISTGMRISRELAPVYLSWNKEQQTQKSYCQKVKEFFVEFYLVFFAQNLSITHRLHAQAEAIHKLLLVSSVIAFFFLVRCFAFMYLLYISPTIDNEAMDEVVDEYGYPFFFYQIPELIPNLAIVIGISPPRGVIRLAWNYIWGGFRAILAATNPFRYCYRTTTTRRSHETRPSTFGDNGVRNSALFSWRPSLRPSQMVGGVRQSVSFGSKNFADFEDEEEEDFEDYAKLPVNNPVVTGGLRPLSDESKIVIRPLSQIPEQVVRVPSESTVTATATDQPPNQHQGTNDMERVSHAGNQYHSFAGDRASIRESFRDSNVSAFELTNSYNDTTGKLSDS